MKQRVSMAISLFLVLLVPVLASTLDRVSTSHLADAKDGNPTETGLQSVPPAFCWAPDTDPDVIRAFYDNFSGRDDLSLTPFEGWVPEFQFPDGNRWSSTATDGGGLGQGDPTTITWSIVPDGTPMPTAAGEPPGPSNFIAFLDGIYGSGGGGLENRPWFPILQGVFDRWAELTGNTYVYEPNDDGSALSGAAGALGVRGDVRIGGHFIDGNSNILAYNFFPNNGDMVFDTGDNFYSDTSNNSIRLRNVTSHEHGHGLGIRHVCPISQTKLLEPFYTNILDGPQFDDILAGNRGYGDPYEPNDDAASATGLGNLGPGDVVTRDMLSLDDNSDTDYFAFTVPAAASAAVTMTPIGMTYLSGPQNPNGSCTAGSPFDALRQSDLGVDLLATDGVTILAAANANGPGVPEVINSTPLGGAGTYYVRVSGDANAAQMYRLEISVEAGQQLPDLRCDVPSGWDGAIVASSVPNTNVTDVLTGGEVTYVDWAIINDGGGDAGPFNVILRSDGVTVGTWNVGGLGAGVMERVQDTQLTFATGAHVLSLHIDETNMVPESDELNNECQRTFVWNAPVVECAVSRTNIDFGMVPVGSCSDQAFDICNPVTATTNLTGTVSESCNHYSIGSGGGAYTLAPGQCRTVIVRFCPTVEGGTWTCNVETGNPVCPDVFCTGTGGTGGSCVGPLVLMTDPEGWNGQTVTAYAALQESPWDVDAFALDVQYDTGVLAYVDFAPGDLTVGFNTLNANENVPGVITIGGFQPASDPPIPAGSTGNVICLNFQVVQCTVNGQTSILTPTNFLDDLVGIPSCNGTFLCVECVSDGDVNGNGVLSPGDAKCAFDIFLFGQTIPPDCDVPNWDCELIAADANCNATVSPGDALCIFNRFLFGQPPMPCGCPFPTASGAAASSAAEKTPFDVPRDGIVTVGDVIRVPVVMEASRGALAFGFEVNFDREKLRYEGIMVGSAAEEWKALDANEVTPGCVIAGGFDPEGIEAKNVSLGGTIQIAELRFRKLSADGTIGSIEWVEQRLDREASEEPADAPDRVTKLDLGKPFPNPFRDAVSAYVMVPTGEPRTVKVSIYDVKGRLVKTLLNQTVNGVETVSWDRRTTAGEPVSSGIYFMRMEVSETGFAQTRKLVVLK